MSSLVAPEFKGELRERELHAAGVGVRTFASIFQAGHRELIEYQPQVSFELINFMELIGESMGIGEQPAELAQLKALLAPCPTWGHRCWPVSPRLGTVKNNDPSLIESAISGFPR